MGKQNVALVYNFFAHYREPILKELLENSECRWILYGDVKDSHNGGIKAWVPENKRLFVKTNCCLFAGFLLQQGIISLALQKDIDCVVYIGDWHYVATWISAILARLSGKRVLFWTQGWLRREEGFQAKIRNTFYRLAHGLLLYGHQAKEYGSCVGFKPESLYVIYNSLDYFKQIKIRESISLEDIEATKHDLFQDAGIPIVVCSCRLTTGKQVDQLIKAAAILKNRGQLVNILIVGDGQEYDTIQKLASDLGVNVCMYGSCYDENILARLFMSANISVIPGAAGLSIMHSLVYGTPVVVHNESTKHGPEFEAIIPGVNGDIYTKDDIDALAEVIYKWVANINASDARSRKCWEVIELLYNPILQRRIIDRAVMGLPADDLFWLKEQTG